MLDFSVVSGSAGLWKPSPLLLWTERTGIGALFGMCLITLLQQTAWLILSLTWDTTRLILVHFSSSIVFIVPHGSIPSSLSFMNFCSLYMLHDRSRQSTKTCADCHTIALLAMEAYLMTYFNTYISMRCWEEKYRKGLFRWYKGSYELLGIEQDISCDIISVVSYFFLSFVYLCVSFLNMYFFDISHYFPFFTFHI